MKKITTIVAAYNVERYILRCIESVLGQTYKNLEIIIINDGSTDKTKEILENIKNLDSRIKIIHKKNGGISSVRNLGIDKSTGYYIHHLDGDDWLEPEMYDKMIKFMEKNDLDMSICNFYFDYDNGKKKSIEEFLV